MHNDPIYLLKPVFDWLDGLIRDHGDYLFMLLVYVSIPLVGLDFEWRVAATPAAPDKHHGDYSDSTDYTATAVATRYWRRLSLTFG